MEKTTPELLTRIANRLRILSIEATTRAASGHPTSCCSAADLVAALFFRQMRFDPSKPRDIANDRFVLSKGHAAPLLYAAWAETGHVKAEDILHLRELSSKFEGHPTPRLDFVDVATGSLGQGLGAGVGLALGAKMDGSSARVYVMMGDGEVAEGSVWEAASFAGLHKMEKLVAIVDVNRLGQSQATAFGHDVEIYAKRFEAFGWKSLVVDGHDMPAILEAFDQVEKTNGLPLAIIARTIKGKGIAGVEDQDNWHGKALKKDQADEAIRALEKNATSAVGKVEIAKPAAVKKPAVKTEKLEAPRYEEGKEVAARKAFGNALLRVGKANPDVVVIDGDTENSTYTEIFGKEEKDRFFEAYIAEQNMVGMAAGLSALGKIPFVSTFAAFLTRAYDQIRMSAISQSNLKLVGTHAGISIGEDGPSQMGVEDIAMMRAIAGSVVLSPSDAYCTERLVELMAEKKGIHYLRAARAETPILYKPDDKFEIGGARVLRQNAGDQVTVIGTGITVFEALKAQEELKKQNIGITVIDAYSIKPLAKDVIAEAMRKTNNLIVTVEDHSIEAGLGDAVAGELSALGARVHKLGVREVAHSGKKDELLAKYGIDSQAIVKAVQAIVKAVQAHAKAGK